MIEKNRIDRNQKKAIKFLKAMKMGLVAIGAIAIVGTMAAIVLDPATKEKKEEVKEGYKDV